MDLKKGRLAKDGLIQYRIACQQVNVQSLEEVLKKFLGIGDEESGGRTIVAAGGSTDELMQVADLELEHTPEQVMLKAYTMITRGVRSRRQRRVANAVVQVPLGNVQKLLGSFAKQQQMEALYQLVAIEAFNFASSTRETRNLDVCAKTCARISIIF